MPERWSEVEDGFSWGRRDPLDVDVPREPDHGTQQHLNASDQEQPSPGVAGVRGEEQDAADDEPDADQDVVSDAQDLVAPAQHNLFAANTEANVIVAHTPTMQRQRRSRNRGTRSTAPCSPLVVHPLAGGF